MAYLEREFHEWTNSTNFCEIIRAIRKFVPFALKVFDFEKAAEVRSNLLAKTGGMLRKNYPRNHVQGIAVNS